MNKAKYHKNVLKFNMSKMLIETIPIPLKSQNVVVTQQFRAERNSLLKECYRNSTAAFDKSPFSKEYKTLKAITY